jgi:hypothetical protein
MTPSAERRLRELRSRVLVRSWEYRQRRHARGVWFRLRRVLADAREAYVIPREEALRLIGEGLRPEPVGQELDPPRLVLFVPGKRLARIAAARPVAVRLEAGLLSAECLALTAFDTPAGRGTSPSEDGGPRG